MQNDDELAVQILKSVEEEAISGSLLLRHFSFYYFIFKILSLTTLFVDKLLRTS
jgi:hypothetical protein